MTDYYQKSPVKVKKVDLERILQVSSTDFTLLKWDENRIYEVIIILLPIKMALTLDLKVVLITKDTDK